MNILRVILFPFLTVILTLLSIAFACTSFCMDTPQGPIFGANLDYFVPGDGLVVINRRGIEKTGFGSGTTGETARWVSKYESVTFNLAGVEFAFGGMNEAGLVLSTLELMASEMPELDERPPLTIGTWAQYVLDNCATIEEVLRVDKQVRIEDKAPPNHYLIADASGNGVAIEFFDGHLVPKSGEDLPVIAMSNMPYGRALEAYERGGPRWWWSNPGQSAERFAGAAWRCATYKDSGESDAIKYAFDTLTRVVAAGHTKWNLVYDIPKREVWFRSAESPTVKHLSLNAFDLSCDAPLLMLDINAAVGGNVEDDFSPYNHEINLTIFQNLCARNNIHVTQEDAIGLMHLIEGFDCSN